MAKLSVNGASFWISSESNSGNKSNDIVQGNSIRMILIVDDPDTLYAQAIRTGATQVFPAGEGHGWRIGRLVDPFGPHWELGYQPSE